MGSSISTDPRLFYDPLQVGIGIQPQVRGEASTYKSIGTLGLLGQTIPPKNSGTKSVPVGVTCAHVVVAAFAIGASKVINQPGEQISKKSKSLGTATLMLFDDDHDSATIQLDNGRSSGRNRIPIPTDSGGWQLQDIAAPAALGDEPTELAQYVIDKEPVCKYGLTTLYTTGTVNAYPFNVHFSDGSTANGTIKMAGAFAKPGDSGSSVVKIDGYKLVGLLIGVTGDVVSYALPIAAELNQLQVRFVASTPAVVAAKPVVEQSAEMKQKLAKYNIAAKIVTARSSEFMNHPGVTGVGCGYKVKGGQQTDEIALIICVVKKMSEGEVAAAGRQILPKTVGVAEFGTISVDVQEMGYAKRC